METVRTRGLRACGWAGLGFVLAQLPMPVDASPDRRSADASVSAVAPLPSDAAPQVLVLDDHPLVGRVYDVRGRRWVEPDRVDAAVADARYVLLGERHGNADHHRLQARLLAAAARERRVAVVLEQIDFAKQPAIDACRTECGDFAAELGERVQWAASGWPAYVAYRPILDVVASAGLTLYAGNPGTRRVRALGRGEAPEPHETQWFADAAQPLPPAGRERLVADLVRGHCGFLQPASAEPMVRAQRIRDAAFAATLLRGASADGAAALIAGSGHVRRDYGVPTLLPADASLVVVGFAEVAAGAAEPEAYGPLDAYDYVWFTRRVDEPDPCAKMRAGAK